MRITRTHHKTITRVLAASTVALALMVLALGSLMAASTLANAGASPRSSSTDRAGDDAAALAAPSHLLPGALLAGGRVSGLPLSTKVGLQGGEDIELSPDAPTEEDSNIAVEMSTDTIAYINESINYIITVTNKTNQPINNVLVLDDLPRGKLTNIDCPGDCEKIIQSVRISDATGATVVIEVTRRLTWTTDLAPNEIWTGVFSATLTGQTDGTEFTNRAFVYYTLNGTPYFVRSNDSTTTARVRISFPGVANMSQAPTWYSEDLGGTLSQDWGDFDTDGDLDLVLGSAIGTTIYRNTDGVLQLFWQKERLTYGVRWADLDGDGLLELLAVGDSSDRTSTGQGFNYIYIFNPEATVSAERFEEFQRFYSPSQLVRAEPGDYNLDGKIDLIVSTNSINAGCPVHLYENEYQYTDTFPFFFTDVTDDIPITDTRCISPEASASMAVGDYDNDGTEDLVLGLFETLEVQIIPGTVMLDQLTSSSRSTPDPDSLTPVDNSIQFLPYDFAWGDYDQDGYLDLAAAYPLEQKVQVYHNEPNLLGERGFVRLPDEISTSLFRTPLAVDWADLDGDGKLELVVADSPIKVYEFVRDPQDNQVEPVEIRNLSLNNNSTTDQLWSVRAIDYDNDNDLDLSVTNRDGPSQLLTNFAPFLNTTVIQVDSGAPAGSVALGDMDGDGDMDMLLGAGPADAGGLGFASRLHTNEGRFENGRLFQPEAVDFAFGVPGPHQVAFGDVDRDNTMDIFVGTVAENEVYLAGDFFDPWRSTDRNDTRSIAWGDSDGDGDIDLLTGNVGLITLYVNGDTALERTPSWSVTHSGIVHSVAWGDYNNDRYIDFAVGGETSIQVYRNLGNNTFSAVWGVTPQYPAKSVAWGDYDRDGDPDLAVGQYGGQVVLYNNLLKDANEAAQRPTLDSRPIAITEYMRNTTSIAWGDWDNDGDVDLAVGNEDQPNQVYVNSSKAGAPLFNWLWASTEPVPLKTTGVAWGDIDKDGDLDLAISQRGSSASEHNGVYLNNYVQPTHMIADTEQEETLPLPNNPSYVWLDRPGGTKDAYLYSSAELLSGPLDPIITITYQIYDPDGRRVSVGEIDPPGDRILSTTYEYSVDGGATWERASLYAGTPITLSEPVTQTFLKGNQGIFVWDAQRDAAISDNARFRVRIIHQPHVGRTQRASTSAVSPPFRVRGLTCIWPDKLNITTIPDAPAPKQNITFLGTVLAGSGVMTFTWNFGDFSPRSSGQVVRHAYKVDGSYLVTLAVTGEACPESRTITTTRSIRVGSGAAPLYLPVLKLNAGRVTTNEAPAASVPSVVEPTETALPPQVTGLRSVSGVGGHTSAFEWKSLASQEISGYRVYRSSRTSPEPFELVATLSADVNRYTDETATCGHIYYVTTFDAKGESLPSTASYLSPLCQP